MNELFGFPVIISPWVPKGKIFIDPKINSTITVNLSDWLVLKYGRTPFWTKYMLGVREAERDRRKYGTRENS